MHFPCATLSSVACLALQYFSTLSHKRQDFLHATEHNLCILISLQDLSEQFLILRRIHRETGTSVQRFSCKLPVIFVRF